MPARPGRGRGAASAGDLSTGTFAGQAQRFEDVYLREFASVFALAYAMLGSRWAAEDIAQDAFVVAHRQWGRVGGYEDPGAWVRRVAANLAVSGVRRRLAEARALVRLTAHQRQQPYADLPSEDGDFWRAVRRLPRRQAQVVALLALGELTTAEVASTLGCSQRTVQVHLQKARATLAERLGLPAEGVDR
jgi:RNA polymerase sigma-70 factor, ECF subfamily